MDADSPASRTAIMVAAYRARASAREAPVCTDPWAEALAGEEGMELSCSMDRTFPHMELWVALRTAYFDRHVAYWTGRHGFSQVVVLGAGLDTRAARLAAEGVRFFEVDHPATQAEKRRLVGALEGYPGEPATYVSCDFEREDFVERLAASGFDAGAPALVIWEGVAPYLTEEAVRATCRRIAGGLEARSVLCFDYLRKRMVTGDRLREADRETLEVVRGVGEPVTWGSDDPLPLLYEEGFRHVRKLDFNEIALSLTGTYERERMFRFQHVAIASRTPPP